MIIDRYDPMNLFALVLRLQLTFDPELPALDVLLTPVERPIHSPFGRAIRGFALEWRAPERRARRVVRD